jgi:hypothetical protein
MTAHSQTICLSQQVGHVASILQCGLKFQETHSLINALC